MTDLKNYIKEVYPNGIRKEAYITGSITDSYDEVRAFTLGNISDNITFTAKQLLITTSTIEGIIEWENYLGVSFPNRTLEERRGNLLSRIAGTSGVLSLMKAVTYLITGGDATSVTFIEHWTIAGDVFTYEVKINDNLVSLTYDTVILRQILEGMQPAHCTLIITITNDLIDAIGTTSALDSALLTQLTWGSGNWEDNPMIAHVWG